MTVTVCQHCIVQFCDACLTKISNACAVAIDAVLGKSRT